MSKKFGTEPKGKGKTTSTKRDLRTKAEGAFKPKLVQKPLGQDGDADRGALDPAKEKAVVQPIVLDTPPAPAVTSDINTSHNNGATAPQQGAAKMELIKDTKERKGNGKSYHYHVEGLRGSVKISSTMFAGTTVPNSIPADSFGFGTPGAKAGETKDERKARLAALPKLTPAEKLAKLEAKVARAKAKLAGAAAM